VDNAKSTDSVQKLEQKYGTKDGAKLFMKDGSWLLIRASGTEPIVRVYAEGVGAAREEAHEKSQKLIDAVQKVLTEAFSVPAAQIKEKT
jgi:phosphomannomutase